MAGPLQGLKIVEVAGIGPGPFCAMMLADMGAEVLRIDRLDAVGKDREVGFMRPGRNSILNRGRRSVALDLKSADGVETFLELIDSADALIEGFRPGVMERLGIGPEVCHVRNPRLVYGRITGWGQDGPLHQAAGHDINYIAISGALHTIGRADGGPVAPPAMIGDIGGGAMMLAFGIVSALLEARQSGRGQVVDAAITDGAALMASIVYEFKAMGLWSNERQTNLLDGGAHFYDTYQCADGKWISIGAIEPQFYSLLIEKLEIDDPEFSRQLDPAAWPTLKQKLATKFRTKTRDEWCAVMEGTDACFAPVLSLDEARHHPHNVARNTFIERGGVTQPAPAPRFSRTTAEISMPAPYAGEHNDKALADWGVDRSALSHPNGTILSG
ncbi:CaiB/BaiF CoA transferase family protein [Noviherbaspirillum sp. Root189]|uniref:CaiB/BaiF CoA transferase family protein n=1 Tax=Noviherbaspirillum sp. Root189 TaxID=1736487 RepID=UPI00070EA6C4|nr:CaiB/BaiF CoA-transferase family protein [Noviherbaspirillum sp. Root189]KRB80993.1 carnitine dehydratase [Noviherbaspirillum sp. Root189]